MPDDPMLTRIEARQRLIEAAPDLLAALQNLLAVRRGEGGTQPNADALAEAAIAKATGHERIVRMGTQRARDQPGDHDEHDQGKQG